MKVLNSFNLIYFKTFKMPLVSLVPNYDDLGFILNLRPLTRSNCINSCINRTNCNAIVYLPNTQECYLKEKRDIFNGFLRDVTHELLILQSLYN